MIYILFRDTDNISGVGKRRPPWFSFEKCFDSLVRSIEGKPYCQLRILHDGVNYRIHPSIYVTRTFNGGSDLESYRFSWNYAMTELSLLFDDLVFFAENDYIFSPDWPEKVLELYDTFTGIDYVTLYDHPDKYNLYMYPTLQSQIMTTKTHHWRTTPSTTGSIICSKKILFEDYHIHLHEQSDKIRCEQLGLFKGRTLFSPIPSLSTHCEEEYLAPLIDWQNL